MLSAMVFAINYIDESGAEERIELASAENGLTAVAQLRRERATRITIFEGRRQIDWYDLHQAYLREKGTARA